MRPGLAVLSLLVALAGATGCGEGKTPSRPFSPGPGPRLYVANTGERTLSVVDGRTHEVAGVVDLGASPHGLAAAPDGRVVYATVGGRPGSVLAVDTADHRVLWRVEVGPAPQQPAVTRDGARLFVPDLLDSALWIVDLARRETKRLQVRGPDGKTLEGLHNAYAGARGVIVTSIRSHALAVLDPKGGETLEVHALPGEPRPAALAPDGARVYVQLSGFHGFVAWDLTRREEAGRVEWGPIPDEVPPPPWTPSHGLGIEPSGGALWATSTPDRVVRIHSLPGLEPLGEVAVGEDPNWIAFSPDGAFVYVSNTAKGRPRGSVTVVDRATRSVRATVPVGREPKRIVALVAP